MAFLGGSTGKEQMENALGGLTEEHMLEFGYNLDTMQKFSASVAAAPKEKPVLVLTSWASLTLRSSQRRCTTTWPRC